MIPATLTAALPRLRSFARRYGTPLWTALLLLCAAAFFIQARADFARAIEIITTSSPLWIGLIVAAQVAGLAVTARTYQMVLRQCRKQVRLSRLIDLQLERKVVGTLVPAGGPASVYVFVRGVGRHGVCGEDALLTVGLRSVLGYVSFMSLLLPAVLLARPEGVFLAGAATLVGTFALLIGILLLLARYPRPAHWLAGRLPARAREMLARVRGHQIRLRALFSPYLLALAGQFANVVTLAAALYALGYSPSLVSVLAGYTVGTAVLTLAPVFQGIGVVEVSMAVTLQQFGAPAEVAIGATLLYRGATVWLPLLIGLAVQAARRIALPRPVSAPTPNRALAITSRPAWRGLITCALLVALMVTLSGSATTTTDRHDGPPLEASRIALTAR